MCHKRPGTKAKLKRKVEAEEKLDIKRRIVAWQSKWEKKDYYDISPGYVVAEAKIRSVK